MLLNQPVYPYACNRYRHRYYYRMNAPRRTQHTSRSLVISNPRHSDRSRGTCTHTVHRAGSADPPPPRTRYRHCYVLACAWLITSTFTRSRVKKPGLVSAVTVGVPSPLPVSYHIAHVRTTFSLAVRIRLRRPVSWSAVCS
ncbi:hypothetical protein DENSPDRAFT_197521 [Dentipellis sp. KUC8613]|nr:hypothetical protein DENSPDRAFT_197521 [Dentipellis sp. KUC8613]